MREPSFNCQIWEASWINHSVWITWPSSWLHWNNAVQECTHTCSISTFIYLYSPFASGFKYLNIRLINCSVGPVRVIQFFYVYVAARKVTGWAYSPRLTKHRKLGNNQLFIINHSQTHKQAITVPAAMEIRTLNRDPLMGRRQTQTDRQTDTDRQTPSDSTDK